jgi:hypothetical protein
MFEWLTGKKTRSQMPGYSRLRAVPTRPLPPDLAREEAGEFFSRDGRPSTLEAVNAFAGGQARLFSCPSVASEPCRARVGGGQGRELPLGSPPPDRE